MRGNAKGTLLLEVTESNDREAWTRRVVAIRQLALSAVIGRWVTLKKVGPEHVGRCPFHEDRTPSFTVNDKKGFFHCFGCLAHGDLIAFVTRHTGLGFRKAVELIEAESGLSGSRDYKPVLHSPSPPDDDSNRLSPKIWNETLPLPGTPGELNLKRRRVSYEGDALRWHPSCPFGKGLRHGCMIGLVRNVITNEPQAIHRTAIDADGNKIDRKALGPIGGGAVKLTADADVTTVIAIGEGIETTLSIRELPDLKNMPVWACLTAGGLAEFPVLPGIEAVWIAADNDASGTGQRAAETLARRLDAAGVESIIIVPRTVGADLNDRVAHRA